MSHDYGYPPHPFKKFEIEVVKDAVPKQSGRDCPHTNHTQLYRKTHNDLYSFIQSIPFKDTGPINEQFFKSESSIKSFRSDTTQSSPVNISCVKYMNPQ